VQQVVGKDFGIKPVVINSSTKNVQKSFVNFKASFASGLYVYCFYNAYIVFLQICTPHWSASV
jgi:hypothetical protein